MLHIVSERKNQMKADQNSSLSTSVDDNLHLHQATFRQLHKIVKDEMQKPVPSQDSDLITECVHMMNEIKGGKNLSPAVIAERCKCIMNQSTKTAARTHIRCRPILVAVCIVCIMFTCGLAVYAVNPVFRDWVVDILSFSPGTVIEENGITYVHQGKPLTYDSIEQCIIDNNLDIYYPSVLPDHLHLNQLQFVTLNGTDTLWFIFDDSNISFTIQFSSDYVLGNPSDYELYTFLDYNFYCTENNDMYFASAYINENLYTISASSHDALTMIIDNLTES